MAISISWGTKVIYVPQADLTPLGGSLYQLDIDWFRLQLKALEDGDEGMIFPDTHTHNTTVVLSGVTYARVIEIINGYTVEFEDDHYSVVCSGANHNLGDVKVVNQVSLVIGNSAGLVEVGTSGLTPTEAQDLQTSATAAQAAQTMCTNIQTMSAFTEKLSKNKAVVSPDGMMVTIYDDDKVTPLHVYDISADGKTRDPQ